MIEGQKTIIDTLFNAHKLEKEKSAKYEEQLLLKNQEVEAVKPKWWQEPVVIMSEVILALITGFLIAK